MKGARLGAASAVLVAALMVTLPAEAGSAVERPGGDGGAAAHWTAARMAAATPRDLVVDQRGLGYLRRKDGSLQPHGHGQGQLFASPSASRPTPMAKPGGGGGGGGDTAGPTVTDHNPAQGATIGASHTFSATVSDPSGVRSVTFVIISPNGQSQSFAATASGSTWSATLQGFTNGSWTWRVVAKDAVRKGNTTTSDTTGFTVATGGGGGSDEIVTNAPWTGGGTVQQAAGRIFFEMPTNTSQTSWAGYVCSGTVARDGTTGRSVILTAAHCVYDDANKAFARNVIFVPDQDGTTGAGTDRNCGNDPIGCWTTSFGVVDTDWSSSTFPANIPWDYAYYVVTDTGAHAGTTASSDALDIAAGDLAVQFSAPSIGVQTHALGYSYSDDPSFMYCAEPLATETSYDDLWLGRCDLSGGSSGGPWLQPVSSGNGPIISVNSWGYTNQPGMAGPRLSGTSASCLFDVAKARAFDDVTNRGVASC